MRNRTKLVLTALTAALVLSAAVGSASATRLEISNTGIRVLYRALTFSESGGGSETICPVTLEGTFHSRTISKVANSLVGFITRAFSASASCTGAGRAVVLAGTLPWHVRYESFEGTLPNITGINLLLEGASFLITEFGVSCLYRGQARGTAVREAGGAITLRADPNRLIPKSSGGILCPANGRFAGAEPVTNLGGTTPIRVTLVR